jgi:hypothetical protein
LISLYFLNDFFFIIVIGIAGNKKDLYMREEIPEDEGIKFAQEIGAIFGTTSACIGNGIDKLFNKLILQFLEQNKDNNNTNDNNSHVLRENNAKKKNQKKCCGSKK